MTKHSSSLPKPTCESIPDILRRGWDAALCGAIDEPLLTLASEHLGACSGCYDRFRGLLALGGFTVRANQTGVLVASLMPTIDHQGTFDHSSLAANWLEAAFLGELDPKDSKWEPLRHLCGCVGCRAFFRTFGRSFLSCDIEPTPRS